MSRSIRSFVTGKTINKQVQLNNRLTTFTTPPIQTGDLYVTRDLYVDRNTDISGNLTIQKDVYSYGTIYATKYLSGQIVNVSMLDNAQLGQTTIGNATVVAGTQNYQVFTYNYTPKIATSYIIIEYQTIYTVGGSYGNSLNARLRVDAEEISTTYQLCMDGQSISGAIFPIVGRYQNLSLSTKTIGVYLFNDTYETVTINGDNSTWLKITEIGQ
jgi:hypothetical protein